MDPIVNGLCALASLYNEMNARRTGDEIPPATILKTRKDRLEFASSSLKKSTLKCILQNKKYFCDQVHYLSDPFHSISNGMKNDLIALETAIQSESADNVSEEEVDLQCQVLQLLLNKDTTTFEFPPGVKMDYRSVTNLWETLTSVWPTNLQSIVRKCTSTEQTWNLRPFFCQLVHFANLQTLNLEGFICEDGDLIDLSTHLPKLKVLVMELDEKVSEQGFSALSKLPELQVFMFSCPQSVDNMQKWYMLCFQHLPHLHQVGEKFSPQLKPMRLEEEESSLPAGVKIAAALNSLNEPCKLNLQRLVIRQSNGIPDTVDLPYLKALFIVDPQSPVILDERFIKVSEFGLYGVWSMDECVQILGHLGQQLNKLFLHVKSEIDVSKVLDMCPNLFQLHIYSSKLVSSSDLKPDSLSRLLDLKISMTVLGNEDRIKPGLLIQLLHAPKLRTVELNADYIMCVTPEQIIQISSIVKKKGILRKLQKFLVTGHMFEGDMNKIVLYRDAHIPLIFNCPRLHTVAEWLKIDAEYGCGENFMDFFARVQNSTTGVSTQY